ncbi:transcription repressor OFP8-like [Syzygium oleosum]|uniref:transcription repressor OFP8-like n=1 Tax=Syzygium oleosum TaxID=219896 RepID=UPI0011D2C3D2|nr:transcription repressor OFP8-like [Syzygium oleosum]
MPITPFVRQLPRPPLPSLGEINNTSQVEHTKKKATKEEEKEKCPYSSLTTSRDDWLSSDDESDARLSSSRSLSSDSSETRRRRRRRRRSGAAGAGVPWLAGREIEDSFAVVKRSNDPRGDFRQSMVEMIVEKEMFGAEELQKLLECFLALNSHHHHRVILQVFAEIWEALFSSRS